MDWKNKNVLITGAGGFIGSHLVEKIVHLGAKVSAFVRYNSRNDRGLIEILPTQIQNDITVVMGDLRDADAVRNVMKGIDVVFHLGALIAIPYSYNHPREVIETNIIGTLNMITAARDSEVGNIVHTSTSEVYGTAQSIPIDENHPLQGQSPYSASKIGADKIIESFYRSYNLPVTTVRPFNTYGPRQSARAIIPTIITQALTGKKIYLGSLSPMRDFTYVEDIADGFIKASTTIEAIGEVINLGSGFGIQIGDLTKRIMHTIGGKYEIISDQSRVRPEKSEVQRLVADISKAKALLQWEPKTDLENGLEHTVDWIKKNIGRYKTNIYNI